ncbi:hypothetical protein CBR_g12359 [Chara braunii]|uniref:Uncharacterized protein n=1 Tax=Chara braunii TaxID=69332 RepID=A0A388KRV1_CHABU|nr:hypothetical protein CBR_g12359 [Chara braunii]|eukprot:GBG72791.1 hypothetical protein CBR_g12359 [Chara braunii]
MQASTDPGNVQNVNKGAEQGEEQQQQGLREEGMRSAPGQQGEEQQDERQGGCVGWKAGDEQEKGGGAAQNINKEGTRIVDTGEDQVENKAGTEARIVDTGEDKVENPERTPTICGSDTTMVTHGPGATAQREDGQLVERQQKGGQWGEDKENKDKEGEGGTKEAQREGGSEGQNRRGGQWGEDKEGGNGETTRAELGKGEGEAQNSSKGKAENSEKRPEATGAGSVGEQTQTAGPDAAQSLRKPDQGRGFYKLNTSLLSIDRFKTYLTEVGSF